MSYIRVIPRDLFNEANLLKCVGKIALLVTDGKIPGLSLTDEFARGGFAVQQDESDGSIRITNVNFRDKFGRLIDLRIPLNARHPWPIILTHKGEEYYPINSDGEYQLDIALFTRK